MVFSITAQTLTELQTFRGSDTPNGSGNPDRFGREIKISGTTAVISAPGHNSNAGAVYVFKLNSSNEWIQVAKLTSSDQASGREFGNALAFKDDVIIVSNIGADYSSQGAYIFEKPVSGWADMTETIKLSTPAGPSPAGQSGFGYSLDINGPEILIGAPYEDIGSTVNAGRIYVYEKSGMSWSTAFVRAELTTTNVGNGDLIGYSAVFGDNFIVSGALTGSVAGTLHVFEKPSSGTWATATTEDIILFGSDRSSLDGFGGVVGVNGDFITTIGALDGNQSNDMNFYVFEREGTLWSDQSSQNEEEIDNLPSYFPYQGFQNSFPTISLAIQSNLLLVGNGLSNGPTPSNMTTSGSVFINNYRTGSLISEIDGLDFVSDGKFGSAIAIDGSRLLISSPEETRGGVVRYFNLSYNIDLNVNLCPGESTILGTQTITTAGSYQQLFTSQNGLDSLVNLTVEVSDLDINIIKTDVSCFSNNDSEIQVSRTGGLAPFEYSLDGVTYGSQSVFSNLAGGNYDAYVRDANGCIVSESVTITEPAEVLAPSVTNSTAVYGGQTVSGLVITPNASDPNVSHFQITNIVDGSLFKNDGVTSISETDFITLSEGADGLVFVPSQAGTGSFDIQSSGSNTSFCLGGGIITASISVAKAALEGTSNATITYGDPIPTFDIEYGGFVNGDDASVIDVLPTASTTAVQFDDAGNYTITTSGGSDDNYNLFLIDGSLTIEKAQLNLVADNQTKTYGDVNPNLTYSYSGFLGTDNVASLTEEPTISTDATQFSDAGSYDIELAGGIATNYSFSFTNATLSVGKATLNASVDNQSITYGDAIPSFTISYSGFIGSDDESVIDTEPEAATSAQQFDDVASYDITLSGGGDNNYSFNLSNGNLEVTKKEVSVTPDAVSTTYGTIPSDFIVQYAGFVNGDTDAVVDTPPTTSTTAIATSPIGSYYIDATGALDNNYSFVYTTGTLTIAQADLTAEANDKTIVFGDALPTFDGTIAGIMNSDNITTSYSSTATSTSDAGTYPISVTLNDPDDKLDNYNQTLTEGILTIEKADQIITLATINNVDLASNTTVSINASVDSGLPLTYSISQGASIATLNGDNTEITLSGTGTVTLEVSQSGNTNYNTATTVSESFNVADSRKTDQTITFNSISEQVYGDDLTLGATASSNLTVSYALTSGTGTITNGILTIEGVGTYEVTASQNGDNTFNPAPDVTQQFTVVKALLIATADNQTISEGDAIPTLTFSYSGFKLSDDATVLDTEPTISTAATSQSAAGEYAITLSGGSDDTYEFSLQDGTLTIEEVLGFDDSAIQIYPNPSSGLLKIEGLDFDYVKIFDLEGREVLSSDQDILSLEKVSRGIHIIRLYKDKEEIYSQKLVVN